MRVLTQPEFDRIIVASTVRPKLVQELRFEASTSTLPESWDEYELVAVHDRTGRHGVLLLQPYDDLFVAPYELTPLAASSTTGRVRSVICDLCYTWQRGSNAASLVLTDLGTKHTVRFLCCGDLACSLNVRTRTSAAITSRAQMREDLDDEGRIDRLRVRLASKIDDLSLERLAVSDVQGPPEPDVS